MIPKESKWAKDVEEEINGTNYKQGKKKKKPKIV